MNSLREIARTDSIEDEKISRAFTLGQQREEVVIDDDEDDEAKSGSIYRARRD